MNITRVQLNGVNVEIREYGEGKVQVQIAPDPWMKLIEEDKDGRWKTFTYENKEEKRNEA
jgi:hypothetical protein